MGFFKKLGQFFDSITTEEENKLSPELQAVLDAANNGDLEACRTVWNDYKDFNINKRTALDYLKKVADNGGDAITMLQVADCFVEHGGTRIAIDYYVKYIEAIGSDDPTIPSVEYCIGRCCWANRNFDGNPLDERDKMEAYKWFKRAAKHGNDDADAFIATHF